MDISKDPLPSSYEEWYNENSKYLPKEYNKYLDSGEVKNHLSFVFAWKRYEQLTVPLLQALMVKQYPTVAAADESYEKHRQQNMEHRIFETATFAWQIIQHNEKKEQPKQVMPETLKHAEEGIYNSSYYRIFYNAENPPEELIKSFGEEKGWQLAEEWNRDQQDSIDYLNTFYHEVIAELQEHLLAQFPQLLEMDAEWWKIYRFLFLEQCSLWKDNLDKMEHLVEHKMSGDWLDKPHKELQKELDRLYKIKWQKEYGNSKE